MHGGKLPDPSNTEPCQRGYNTGHQCELIEYVKIGGGLGGSDCALEEFTVHRDMGQKRGKESKLPPLP